MLVYGDRLVRVVRSDPRQGFLSTQLYQLAMLVKARIDESVKEKNDDKSHIRCAAEHSIGAIKRVLDFATGGRR